MHLFWLTTFFQPHSSNHILLLFSLSCHFVISYHHLAFNCRYILSRSRATKNSNLWRRKESIGATLEGSFVILNYFIFQVAFMFGLYLFEFLYMRLVVLSFMQIYSFSRLTFGEPDMNLILIFFLFLVCL